MPCMSQGPVSDPVCAKGKRHILHLHFPVHDSIGRAEVWGFYEGLFGKGKVEMNSSHCKLNNAGTKTTDCPQVDS